MNVYPHIDNRIHITTHDSNWPPKDGLGVPLAEYVYLLEANYAYSYMVGCSGPLIHATGPLIHATGPCSPVRIL